MSFRVARTLPPAAAPIPLKTILSALPNVVFNAEPSGEAFENEIKEYFGSRYCFLLSSGKAALVLILAALKELYPDRDEVLIPAFTCYSVPAAIKKAGLRIKLCDLAPASLDFDHDQLRAVITTNRKRKKLLCVLATHLFGCAADISGIQKIVGPDIPVVEDAAQAMGAEFEGRKLGTSADVGFFSLGRGKALSTGEGGIIITSQKDLAGKIAVLLEKLPFYNRTELLLLLVTTLLTNILQKPFLFWLPKSIPYLKLGKTYFDQDFTLKKFSSLQRKLACQWQVRLSLHRQTRNINGQFWTEYLRDRFQFLCRENLFCNLIRMPLLAPSPESRKRIIEVSERKGLGIMPGYPTTINKIPEIAGDFAGCQFPRAHDLCERLFTIPVHELLNDQDNERILSFLRSDFP
jgi:dTDP-4-amino-4,6-dideoxygalactose transaminase